MKPYNWLNNESLDDYSFNLSNYLLELSPEDACPGPCGVALALWDCQCRYYCQKCWLETGDRVNYVHRPCDKPRMEGAPETSA